MVDGESESHEDVVFFIFNSLSRLSFRYQFCACIVSVPFHSRTWLDFHLTKSRSPIVGTEERKATAQHMGMRGLRPSMST